MMQRCVKNDWNVTQNTVGTKIVKVHHHELEHSTNSHIELEEHIKMRLTEMLTRELFKQELIKFTKTKRYIQQRFGYETMFTAEINVSDKRYKTTIQDEREFFVNDESFTDEEIRRALIQKCPERLI